MRRCAKCGQTKPAEQFAEKGRGLRQAYCRPCQAQYRKEHYERHRRKYIDKAAARTRAERDWRTRWLTVYLAALGCADCGERDPVVLEFDHVRGTKSFSISSALVAVPFHLILREIGKCDVVCANCHRRRTARRAGHLRTRF
jgi:hypothetical protein